MLALLVQGPAARPWFEPHQDSRLDRPAAWRGVAWNDIDGDGYPDLAASRSGGIDLYRNVGGELVPHHELLNGEVDGEGIALVDVNGDARPDLFVASLRAPPRLFHNEGAFRFAAVADDLQGVTEQTHAGCFADFDGDGWLDLVLVTRGTADDLVFRNDRGRFRRVQDALAGSAGDGRTCAVGDWNGDGRVDIYLGNFLETDHSSGRTRRAIDRLYLNQGGMRFVPLMRGHVVNLPSMTYGAVALDWNEDGWLDLSTSNDGRADRNVLYENLGREELELYPRGDEIGLTAVQRGPSKGQSWGDYDNDGDLDVVYAEGTAGIRPEHAPFDVRDELYEQIDGRFVHREEAGLDASLRLGAGVANADYDRDGDLDLMVANWGGEGEPLQLYRNVAGGRSISFALRNRGPNTQAIGARIELTVRRGGRTAIRRAVLWPQTGYASMNEPVLHFGLGAQDILEAAVVTWPDGWRQAVTLDPAQLGRIIVRRD